MRKQYKYIISFYFYSIIIIAPLWIYLLLIMYNNHTMYILLLLLNCYCMLHISPTLSLIFNHDTVGTCICLSITILDTSFIDFFRLNSCTGSNCNYYFSYPCSVRVKDYKFMYLPYFDYG